MSDHIQLNFRIKKIQFPFFAVQSLTGGSAWWEKYIGLRDGVMRENGKNKQSNKNSQISNTNKFIIKIDTYRIYINNDP